MWKPRTPAPKATVDQRIIGVVCKFTRTPGQDIRSSDRLIDIGATGETMLNVALALEVEFQIEVETAKVPQTMTVKQLIDYAVGRGARD